MTPNKKKHLINDIFVVIMLLAALLTIIRLWPLLLLLLIGLIAYALWVLFRVSRQPVKPEPTLLPMLPAPVTEQSMLSTAFSLLQRRISEQVNAQYPNARWVWSVPDAFKRFAAGQDLVILLNGAGGYRKATVRVKDLQFTGLFYHIILTSDSQGEQPKGVPSDPPVESESVDYGLLSFEWVEANMQHLNVLSNETVAAGQVEFRIPAEELPHGDSWPMLCAELVRNGFAAAKPLADGIHVKIKTTE